MTTKPSMKLIFFILLLLIGSICMVWEIPHHITSFFIKYETQLLKISSYYEQHLRGNLFAGLISVSAILMTGMTFILITMKQYVFDDPLYIANYEKMKKHNPELKLYTPLIELKKLLYLSVMITFLAAIIQFTMGLIPHWSMAVLSMLISVASIILVINSLIAIKKNLDFWLKDDIP